mmetsp:Transcript_76224/g.145059  ORF Transcript_76224/g.145059 Transcript_76224/m.145059 type:complete len:269 (+) Transcript_76224:51-857(+)
MQGKKVAVYALSISSAFLFAGFVHSRYPLLTFFTSSMGKTTAGSMPAMAIPMDASGLMQERIKVESLPAAEIPMDANGLIQKRIKVEPMRVDGSTGKGGKTVTDSIKNTAEAVNSSTGPTCPPSLSPLNIDVHTRQYGNENSWFIHGCYLSDTGGMCAGGGYGSQQSYKASCCCPLDKVEVMLQCRCSYGDGWHGGYIEINGDGVEYCKGFLSGYRDFGHVSLSNSQAINSTSNATAVNSTSNATVLEINEKVALSKLQGGKKGPLLL